MRVRTEGEAVRPAQPLVHGGAEGLVCLEVSRCMGERGISRQDKGAGEHRAHLEAQRGWCAWISAGEEADGLLPGGPKAHLGRQGEGVGVPGCEGLQVCG